MLRQMLRALLPRLQPTLTKPAARADLSALLRATQLIETLQHVLTTKSSAAVELLQVLPEMVFPAKCAFADGAVCADAEIVHVVKVRGRGDIGLAAEGACLS